MPAIPATITLVQPGDGSLATASDQRSNDSAVQAAINGLIAWASGFSGSKLTYVEFTSAKTATSSTEASAVTVVSAGALTFDGVTEVKVEFWCPSYKPSDNTNGIVLTLFDGTTSTVVGQLFKLTADASGHTALGSVYGVREFTPTVGAHTYFVGILDGGAVTSTHAEVDAGTGGAGALLPGFIRIAGAG